MSSLLFAIMMCIYVGTVAKVSLIPVLVGIFSVFVFCGLMRSCLSSDSFVPLDDCLRLTPEPENGLHTKVSVSCYFFTLHVCEHNIQCESKNPPLRLSEFFSFFHKRLRVFNRFLHTYYTFLCTLDYKFLCNYLQL